jgi:PelA/Pel-15E family pectate lyase
MNQNTSMKIAKLISIIVLTLGPTFCFAQDKSSEYFSKRWKDVAINMPADWYGSDEAKLVAENVLLGQKEIGGWEKNKAFHQPFSASEKKHYINDKDKIGATFDNGATTTELRFLAKVYSQFNDARYEQAFIRGLEYIFVSQYNNGGWPQYYPLRNGYYTRLTYNDDAMVNILKFLEEIISENKKFTSLQISRKNKTKAKRAFEKGIDCILKTQIIVDNKPTVWCAQHDEITLAPAQARSYELPSFSGSESVGITMLLMSIENPSEDIITAVNGAVQWFENNKIQGIKLEREIDENGKKNRIVVEDKNAPTLWGRFYDLETSLPYFCSRDGIKKSSLAEISHERRNGYSWYTAAPEKVLKKYPEWLVRHKPFQGQTLSQSNQKNRVIILTDIEADPDDTQSLVRLLLYSNQIDIKGIIATTSCWLTSKIHPESVQKVIEAYSKVQLNLLKHESGFPNPETLSNLVKQGLPKYGMKGVGKGMDSEGSNWIIKVLEKKDERPLWISTWGGVNTLAQALYKIEKTKSKKEAKRLISKLRVYTISDQDDSGIWIRNNFPDLFYIVSPGDDYGSATWTGINSFVQNIDNTSISNKWIAQNIQQNHGPLGAIYPDVAWGVEGDTPAFMSLIPNGLNESENPEWGGWGGRYELYKPDFSKTKEGGSIVNIAPETRAIWTNTIDNYMPYIHKEYGRSVKPDTISFKNDKVTLWRWRNDFQNDFAARMDWCTQSYEEANHPPVPILTHPEKLTVRSGDGFTLDAFNTTDPDGDNVSFLWFNYPEAGTYKKLIKVNGAENVHMAYFKAPEVDKKETAHFILKVTDKGKPQLSRYKRIIVTILPK